MSEQRLPREIEEAKDFLKKFEAADNHLQRIRCFKDGIDTLNDYPKEHPDTPYKQSIANIKLLYTRVLLKRLRDVTDIEEDNCFEYVFILVEVNKEVEEILSEDLSLKKEYDEFLALCKELFDKAFKILYQERNEDE